MRSPQLRANNSVATAAELVDQLARFACVGLSNTFLSYVVYATLVALGSPYLAAGALAFAAGAVNGYRLNRRWTFRASDSLGPRVRYVAVQAAGLAATTGLLWLIVTLATFAANKTWTFAGETAALRFASGPLAGS